MESNEFNSHEVISNTNLIERIRASMEEILNGIKDIAIYDDESGRYKYDDKSVPRVTEIIQKMIHEDAIVQWSNSLGFKHISYTKALNEAAVFGTKTHSTIENYLKEDKLPTQTFFAFESFLQWWNDISKGNEIEVVGQEEKLVCQFFGGTYDLLLKINGVMYLVDFKTSNHVTYKYYIQLAAYNYMLKQKGIQVGGVIILQLNKRSAQYNEYFLNLSDPRHKEYFDYCERTFIALVYGYYHIKYLEKKFKEL